MSEGESMTSAEKLKEIMRLLDEAYDHYFEHESHCKSAEGRVSVHFGTYFDRNEGAPWNQVECVEIYSYVLGPSRTHYFDSLDEALEEVREWHKREMEMAA